MGREKAADVRARVSKLTRPELLRWYHGLGAHAQNDLVAIAWVAPHYRPELPYAALAFTLRAAAPGVSLQSVACAIYSLQGDLAQTIQFWMPEASAANQVFGSELVDTRWPAGSTGATVQAAVNGYVEQNGEAVPFSFPTALTIQPPGSPS